MTEVSTSSTGDGSVRVRFCPSPTGSPHVGFARTALYNWAFARHHGGTFVFRIEDTDKERSTQESYRGMLDTMRWMGLDWDEGPEVGGPHGPYRQSERSDIYRDVLARLAESSYTYDCFCTTEEVDARRKASGSKIQGYDGHCRELTSEQRAAFEGEGRRPVVRFRMPDGSVTWDDLVRGEITFETQFVPDFALCRANGDPLYTLVNPVDDALMQITHVLRGEDLLSSTPRQIPLHRALVELGIGAVVPQFGHLPFVMGEGNKKLSKRDPESHLNVYAERGFLPEGLLNYLALLGWSIAADRDVFTLEEMVGAFDIKDVNPNPARFDLKKLEAINGAHMRLLGIEELERRLLPFLHEADLVEDPPTQEETLKITEGCVLIHERVGTLGGGSRHAGLPLPRRRRLRRDRRRQGARRRGDQGRRRRTRRAGVRDRVDDGRHRGSPARLARRRARAQAAQRVRARARGRDRPPHLAAVVRVPGAAGSRVVAGPPRRHPPAGTSSRERATAAGPPSRAVPTTTAVRRTAAVPAPAAGVVRRAAAPPAAGGPPAPGAAQLPADAAHLDLRLVEADRRACWSGS